MFKEEILDNYFGNTEQEKLYDFCDRYWEFITWMEKIYYNNTENYG